MKTTYGWVGGNGTNPSGFSGLPGGDRGSDVWSNAVFNGAGDDGHWWSSSPDGSLAWVRFLGSFNENVYRYSNNLGNGFSVRCVRDAE